MQSWIVTVVVVIITVCVTLVTWLNASDFPYIGIHMQFGRRICFWHKHASNVWSMLHFDTFWHKYTLTLHLCTHICPWKIAHSCATWPIYLWSNTMHQFINGHGRRETKDVNWLLLLIFYVTYVDGQHDVTVIASTTASLVSMAEIGGCKLIPAYLILMCDLCRWQS